MSSNANGHIGYKGTKWTVLNYSRIRVGLPIIYKFKIGHVVIKCFSIKTRIKTGPQVKVIKIILQYIDQNQTQFSTFHTTVFTNGPLMQMNLYYHVDHHIYRL